LRFILFRWSWNISLPIRTIGPHGTVIALRQSVHITIARTAITAIAAIDIIARIGFTVAFTVRSGAAFNYAGRVCLNSTGAAS
jgi:hypothetical protein